MSAWGTALSSNDLYADIYYEFFELYNEGYEVEEISEKLLRENKEIYTDYEEGYNFWFALAKAQWECKVLDKDVLSEVTDIIETEKDIKVWRELGASESDLRKRKVVLDKFLATLQTEKPKARVRRKKSTRIYNPTYNKGDCLTFKFKNGHYGGAVVLDAVSRTAEFGSYNLIAQTDIDLPTEPTLLDYKKANILYQLEQHYDLKTHESSWHEKPLLRWHSSISGKNALDQINVVGTIDVERKYGVTDYEAGIGYTADFGTRNVDRTYELLEQERSEGKKLKREKLKKFIKEDKKSILPFV